MTTPEQIHKALGGLDVANDNHWTGDGLPRLDTVKMLAGDQSITRDAVTLAAPGFTRANALQQLQATPAAPPPPAAETAAAAPTAAATPETPAPVAPFVPTVQRVQVASQTGLPPVASTLPPASSPSPLSLIPYVDNSALLEAKKQELALVDANIAEMNQALASINKQKQEHTTRSDDLRLQIDKLTPRDDNQQAIGGYLASQKRILERRSEQQQALRKIEGDLGIRIADILPKRSPIDAAMSRRTGYGGQRPK